jgi:AcrR family transcriptional regulator
MTSRRTARPAAAGGRPRSERARRAILIAASELFEKGGYPAATIEAIAERSGVAKTTIYRWWPHRAALMVELLLAMAEQAAPPPAGPDPMRALRTELHRVAEAVDAPPGRLLMALLSEALNDPEVRDALLVGLFAPRRKATADVIRKAQEAGALRADVSPELAVDLFFGPLFYKTLIRQEPATSGFLRQLYENVMIGLRPATRARRRPATRPRQRTSGRTISINKNKT